MSYQMNPPIAPKMPPEVREVFEWCHAYHCRLRRMYRMCCQLFDSGPQTIHLLNQAAPLFFSDVRTAFYDDMQLCISRLTDPSVTGGHSNLGFRRLIDLVEEDQVQDPALSIAMRRCLDAADSEAEPIRRKRNKMIAHNDQATLTGGQDVFLNAGKARFEAIMDNFDEILNLVQVVYGGLSIPRDFLEVGSDADRLVKRLREGQDAVIAVARLSK